MIDSLHKLLVGESTEIQTDYGPLTIHYKSEAGNMGETPDGEQKMTAAIEVTIKNTNQSIGTKTMKINLRKGLGQVLLYDLFTKEQGRPGIRYLVKNPDGNIQIIAPICQK